RDAPRRRSRAPARHLRLTVSPPTCSYLRRETALCAGLRRRYAGARSGEGRNPVAVRVEQRVDEIMDLREIELRRGVRVEHRGLVRMVAASGERGFDGQLLHVDVR